MKTLSLISIGIIALWATFSYCNTPPSYLYKVISTESWLESCKQSHIKLSSMDNDFIHFSTKKQLDRIINKFWKNESEFIVLKVKTKLIPGELVLEANPGGSNKYYHLYNGSIPTNSIASFEKIIK